MSALLTLPSISSTFFYRNSSDLFYTQFLLQILNADLMSINN